MPKFQYKAKNMTGRIMEGVYEAPNQQAVIDMIRQKSYYHLEVKEIVERKDLNQVGIFAKVGHKDLSLFCRQFASILKAGVPLIQSLMMLGEQMENKILKAIINNVCYEVQKGSTLSQALTLHEKKIPGILINMIAAGELSGTLDNSLEVMADHFEKEHKLKQKVKSAMTYPVAVCVISVGVVWFLLTGVVPMFVDMFQNAGSDLPAPTKMLISMSGFLQEHGMLVFMAFVIIGVLVKLYLSGETGRLTFHKKLLTMPLIGKLQTKIIAARFARTLATLMATGVSITEALEITGRTLGNAYATACIKEVGEEVKQGKGLYIPIKALGIFPAMIENMIMLGEETGTLDNMLVKSADFFEEEVDRAVQNLTNMMEPAIIVVLGGIVGFIVLSIALPMFDMASLVS